MFHDFALNAARRCDQVNDKPKRRCQSSRSEPRSLGVLHGGHRDVTGRPQLEDQRLEVGVVFNDHGQVDVAREPHLGTKRDCKTADEREAPTQGMKPPRDVFKRDFKGW
jgi:hypothetical protein